MSASCCFASAFVSYGFLRRLPPGHSASTSPPRPSFRRHRRHTPTCAGRGSGPPAVKPSFYKNPSKAIEKGGGFYIPGLRGPRLRYFVGGTIMLLIATNLNSSSLPLAEQPRSLLVSTAIGVVGAMAVLATAVQDSVNEGAEVAAAVAQTVVAPAPGRSFPAASSTGDVESGDGASLTASALGELSWVADVVRDMVGCRMWVFRGDSLSADVSENTHVKLDLRSNLTCVFSDTSADGGGVEAGPVMSRVAKEGRVFYVEDSESLPEGIGFPFLDDMTGGAAWSVFSVPLSDNGGVLAVARAKGTSLSADDRRWIETLAERVQDSL